MELLAIFIVGCGVCVFICDFIVLLVYVSNILYGIWIRRKPEKIRRIIMIESAMRDGREATYDDYKFFGLLNDYYSRHK